MSNGSKDPSPSVVTEDGRTISTWAVLLPLPLSFSLSLLFSPVLCHSLKNFFIPFFLTLFFLLFFLLFRFFFSYFFASFFSLLVRRFSFRSLPNQSQSKAKQSKPNETKRNERSQFSYSIFAPPPPPPPLPSPPPSPRAKPPPLSPLPLTLSLFFSLTLFTRWLFISLPLSPIPIFLSLTPLVYNTAMTPSRSNSISRLAVLSRSNNLSTRRVDVCSGRRFSHPIDPRSYTDMACSLLTVVVSRNTCERKYITGG